MTHLLFGKLSADECRPACLYCGQELRPATSSDDYVSILHDHAVCCGEDVFAFYRFQFTGKPYVFGHDGYSVYLLSPDERFPLLYVKAASTQDAARARARMFILDVENEGDLRPIALETRPEIKKPYKGDNLDSLEKAVVTYANKLKTRLGWDLDTCMSRIAMLVDRYSPDSYRSVVDAYDLLLKAS